MTNEEIVHNNLTYKLKNNEKPFGLMALELQNKAKELGIGVFDQWLGGIWHPSDKETFDGCFGTATAYRLRPDYQAPEAEVVECEVKQNRHGLHWVDEEGRGIGIGQACNDPDFIGFKLENRLWGRLYKRKDNGDISTCIYATQLDEYEICDMAEAEVLFKKA